MTHQTTAAAAYAHIKPKLPSKIQQVYTEIINGTTTGGIASFQIASNLNWLYHYVTPRITDLLNAGLIKPNGTMTNPTSKEQVNLWVATNITTLIVPKTKSRYTKINKKEKETALKDASEALSVASSVFENLPEEIKSSIENAWCVVNDAKKKLDEVYEL